MSQYYRKIKGKNYDRHLLELVEELAAGRRGGRLAKADVLKMYDAVADANKYTDVEKRTMQYIRKNYSFTEAADELFRGQIRSWAAKKGWETRKKAAQK